MIWMSVFGESGCFGLLRCEEPLVLLSKLEEPLGRFSVRLSHDTILQVFCSIRKTSLSLFTIQSYYPLLRNMLKSSAFSAKLAKIANTAIGE
jgi:hypothetical protein